MRRRRPAVVFKAARIETPRRRVNSRGLLTTASHMPVLLKVLRAVRPSSVLEVGAGWYSTALLQAYATGHDCEHCILETNARYRDVISRVYGCQVEMFDGHVLPDAVMRSWGLVFIDHAIADARKDVAIAIKDHAGVIVLHDANPADDAEYLYSAVIPEWKHHRRVSDVWPQTLVLSDSDEVWQVLGA